MKNLTPEKLLLITVFCLPLYLIRVSFGFLPTNILEILAILSTFYTFAYHKKNTFSKLKELDTFIPLSILLIIVGVFTSILSNNNFKAGFGILKSWFLIPILFSFALYITFDKNNFLKLLKAVFWSSFTVSIVALSYKLLGFVAYDNRLSSFYLSPNHLAMYLAPGIIFGIYLYKQELKLSWIYLVSILIIALPLYFTFSYGTWISLIIAFTAYYLLFKKRSLKNIFLCLFILLVLIFSQTNSAKLNSIFENYSRSSVSSRVTIWTVSIDLIQQHFIFGIGPGNFQNAYLSMQKYYPPFLEWAVPQPHNLFMAFWLQGGLMGLLGFLMIIIYIIKKLYLIIKKERALSASPLFIYLVYILVHGMIDTTYWKNDLSFLFWITIFYSISLITYSREKKGRS